jgi:branched-chain amino acid transport system ATP-binding protein
MLAIGRGLMAKPKCLLLDEPSLGLAPIIVSEIARIIRELAGRGLTIVLVEQNAAMALELADHAYLLESGHVSLRGTAAELQRTDVVRKLYLGA